jgi:S1-C subfamily serine protease
MKTSLAQHRLFRMGHFALAFSLLGLSLSPGNGMAANREEVQLEASILLVKPAVVLLSVEVAADVTVNCGTGPVHRVQPDPTYETGSGFIIHPDGFIATNGHVVQQFYEMNESSLAKEFLARAIAKACGPALAVVPDGARKARLRAIAADPVNRGKVQLFKRLQVHLSTGEIYAAEVKAYSPAIKPEVAAPGNVRATAGTTLEPERSGKDVALLKIDTHDLPTVRLASSSAYLKLGEQIFVLGYPGVVLNHDFLSQKSQLEASVTVGRVSGFKIDLTNRRVIQTDASITWGNSGGPAFNLQGEVIGVATFISTTTEGDQAIQGFNFLIPVDSVREFARQISLVPEPDSPFVREWSQGVKAYFAGEYRRSVAHTDAAIRIMAGFPDIDRLRADAQTQVDKNPRFVQLAKRFGLGLGVVAGIALLAVGIRTMRTRRSPPPAPRRRRPFRRGFVRRPRIARKDHPKPRLPR